MKLKKWLVFSLTVLLLAPAYGQTEQRITLEKAEKIFLDKNYQVLAEQFNINAAQALVL